jgi:hypothetical protein
MRLSAFLSRFCLRLSVRTSPGYVCLCVPDGALSGQLVLFYAAAASRKVSPPQLFLAYLLLLYQVTGLTPHFKTLQSP